MKKFIAGACVLAFSIAGLAGCSQGVDRQAFKDEFYNESVANVPEGVMDDDQVEKYGHCLADGVGDELSDKQLEELAKIIDNGKLELADLPEGVEDVLVEHTTKCAQTVLTEDK
ncbi:hypothetical protein [Arcanobacterium buesumense]|uniref:Uncharacterized protein n=1 Tax=Arcanobacterium buesumense TaxID=2722751 RepID=A0A6H2EJY1_9ACTO|nr:hypothetical protein [Arcanobacterium buesumense]QJC21091.1 hypothetical protein HC352_00200 [Arcanobacterium buesumense]